MEKTIAIARRSGRGMFSAREVQQEIRERLLTAKEKLSGITRHFYALSIIFAALAVLSIFQENFIWTASLGCASFLLMAADDCLGRAPKKD